MPYSSIFNSIYQSLNFNDIIISISINATFITSYIAISMIITGPIGYDIIVG